MKTSELIEKALVIEYVERHEKTDESIFLLDKRNKPIATVSSTELMEIDTRYDSFNCMDNSSKNEMLGLLCEYAKTPLEEREEPKKYKLRHKLVKDSYLNYYLGYIKDENELRFSNSHETDSFKTALTIQEWELLTEQTWEDLLLQFKAIEV